jgi:predicted dehydrogenase
MAQAKQGGGCVLDESHAIDYMRWLLGEIVEVSAVVDRVSSLEIDHRRHRRSHRAVRLRLHRQHPYESLRLEHAQPLRADGRGRRDPVAAVRQRDPRVRPQANRWEIYPFSCQLNDMYVDEARHFIACIEGKAVPKCDGWDGFKTMRVIDAAQRASAERRWVKV